MISCFLLLSHQFVDVSIQRQRLIFCKFLGLQEKPPVPDHCGRKKKKANEVACYSFMDTNQDVYTGSAQA